MPVRRKMSVHRKQQHLSSIVSLLCKAEAVQSKLIAFTSWDQLNEDDLDELNRAAIHLGDTIYGPIPLDISKRVKAFMSWNDSLGGFDM